MMIDSRGAMGALTYPSGRSDSGKPGLGKAGLGKAGLGKAGLVIGVDGGGTKTEVAVADLAANELARSIAGISNQHKVGFDAAAGEILHAIDAALLSAQASRTEVRALVMGISGVDLPEDVHTYEEWSAVHFPNTPVVIVNDSELLLPAGTPDGWGIGVICGTGATTFGRNREGQFARADGWGHLLGDNGSGYWIGNEALRALLRSIDGRNPPTALQEAIYRAWGVDDYTAVLPRVYRPDATPSEISALAPIVTRCAEEGDAVAQEIIARAGASIAESVAAVARRLGLTGPIPFAMAGGVILKSASVREAMLASAVQRNLTLEPVALVERPVLGAVRMAVQLAAS